MHLKVSEALCNVKDLQKAFNTLQLVNLFKLFKHNGTFMFASDYTFPTEWRLE